MKTSTLLWCVAVVAACANVTTPTPDQEARLNEARALLASEPMRALDVAEALLKENPDLKPARLVAAEGSMRLAQAGSGPVNLHYVDAASQFDKALGDGHEGHDADAPLPLQLLAECRYQLGEFEACEAAAIRAANAYAAVDLPENRVGAANARLLAGRAALQRFVAARQQELDGGEPDARGKVAFGKDTLLTATVAAGHFDAARALLPGEATTNLVLLYRWLENGNSVLQTLEQGLRDTPQETAVHDAFLAWMRETGQYEAMLGTYAQLVRSNPTTTILRWHQGRALFARADKLRQDGNFLGGIAAYDKAAAAFGDYLAMVPSHADAARQWLALCDLSACRCAVDMGDLGTAEKRLFAAAETSPATTAYQDGAPQLVDSFGSHFTGAAFAIHAACAESGDDALALALGFNERVLQRFPDRWGFLYNNAALAARDLGVQKSQQGDAAAANDLWERSYGYYEKAVALVPDDARIVNDCGLMLIYHLDRDLDRAQQLFERAIELGKAQLAAMPQDADPRDRERAEEAVGDAWQNLAVLAKEQRKQPFAAYRGFCEEAVKYFPYQRREAAALLRNEGAGELGSTARAQTAARLAAMQGGAAEALKKRRADIDAKLGKEDFDGALAVLDDLAKDCKDHAPYQFLKGDITMKLAVQARDTGRKGVDLFFQDAVSALKRAVELDSEPSAPRQMLAQAQYETGDTESATRTLTALLLHLQSQGGGKPDELMALHALRANAGARTYAAKKQANQDDKELLTAARASFRFVEDKNKLDGALLSLWATMEQWAGAGAEAVNVYGRALARSPEDTTLLEALLNTAYTANQVPVAVEALGKREDALGMWYLGKARYFLADVERGAARNAEAQKALDGARDAFTASMQKNGQYRDSCEQWLAMVLGKKGNIAFWSEDLANAETWLLESIKARPDQATTDLGMAETTKQGLMRVADAHFKKGDLGKVERIYRAASDAANSDLDLLNNSGLFARDWGNQLEDQGKKAEAMGMYEQSYKAYRRAQQLDPQNVRLRNDCALIAIYHLDRDWELSKDLLDTAIADGDKILKETPPGDADEKQKLEEAVGDCYENLALWHLKKSKDGAAAKAAAQASTKYYPGPRRPGARRHLQAAERLLQGK
jgi:tetratricopeptide (TPR) repeat protein